MYEDHYPKVYGFVLKRVTNKTVAEDLTAEIFEKVLKYSDDFQWQGISVSSWIFRIARNHIIDFYRKNSKYVGNSSLDDVINFIEAKVPNVDIEAERDESEVELYLAIKELDSEEQYLIYYKFFEELPNKKIAEITGMSETNVGTKLHRIRKKLQQIMEKNLKKQHRN